MSMNRMKLLAISALAVAAGCGLLSDNLTGGGSDTEVSGRIVAATGIGEPLALVSLLPSSADPVRDSAVFHIWIDTSDAQGRFTFRHVPAGTYHVLAVHLTKRTRGLKSGVVVAKTPVTVPDDTLSNPGTIKIVLVPGVDSVNGYMCVPGTDIVVSLAGNNGFVVLDSVPAGKIPMVSYAPSGAATATVIRYDVSVITGDTTVIMNPLWKYARKLCLNTTPSGADISGNVLGFPVLVRLTSDNFAFGQARTGGADMRFAKPDNTPLPYEIEQWDSVNRTAEIWVKADTVYGNDSTHFIMMYWGASAASASNSAAVFDAANGFLGVWHLGPSLNDATVNRDNGIDTATSDTMGMVGRCRHFDPAKHSFITIPNESAFGMTSNFTLSAWVSVDGFLTQWQTIVAKGDNAYRLHCDSTTSSASFSMTTADTVNYGFKDSRGTTVLAQGAWHLVYGVFDGMVMRTYTDGVLENELTVNMPCLTDNFNLTIGNNRARPQRLFSGSIDEVRVMRTVVSADWVKLCFMNQKAGGDALVVFK
jgi:hypothetical protein